MTTAYNVLLRNAQLDAITAFIGSAATLVIYSGTQPVTGGAAGTTLATFTMASPFAPASSGAVLSPTLPANTTGSAAGTATWFRIFKSGGSTQCIDGTCGTSGTDLILNTATISVGVAVSMTGFTITRGNP